MNELSDRELVRVRLRFIDLIKSFFAAEPDAEKMGRWRGTFKALTGEQISTRFDQAAREMAFQLGRKGLRELQQEYYTLFVDPFEGSQQDTTASYYLNGRAYDRTLVEIRALMKEAGISKVADVADPEDSLVVMLDFLASLLELEEAEGAGNVRAMQTKLLTEYLEPFAVKFEAALKDNEDADFYYQCSRVLGGYLDLEKGLTVTV
jgi:TorA maturation chaperone TorD